MESKLNNLTLTPKPELGNSTFTLKPDFFNSAISCEPETSNPATPSQSKLADSSPPFQSRVNSFPLTTPLSVETKHSVISEFNEIQDIYEKLDVSNHVEVRITDQQPHLLIHEDYAKLTHFARIELMVEELQLSNELAFDIGLGRRNRLQLKKKHFAKYYYDAKAVLEVHDSGYVYSPGMQAFFGAFAHLGIDVETFQFGQPLDLCMPCGWYYADVFNELLLVIRDHCRTSEHRTRVRKHRNNGKRALNRFLKWEEELFEARSRHLMVLVHLGYQPQHRSAVTPLVLQEHLGRMLNNQRSNPLLKGILDYTWKIEEGRRTGLHAHLLVSYDTQRKNGIAVAREFCDYWDRSATRGMGAAWNGNLTGWLKRGDKQRGELGTGQINHDDVLGRAELRKLLGYFAKGDQYLRRKWGAKFKTFGLSRPAEKEVQGRPRRQSEAG